MQHPFTELAPEYNGLLSRMVVTRSAAIDQTAHKLLGFVQAGRYADVSTLTGVPQVWMAASFEREASSDFRLSPAQGDPWGHVSIHVPRGRGPFQNWAQAAEDAYHIDGLDAIGKGNWTAARACYEGEVFNGMGYRAHGIHSPYLWAGTNIYTSGKYIADGVWSAAAIDSQLGIVPVMLRMISLEPTLAFAGLAPIVSGPSDPPDPPMTGIPGVDQHGDHDTRWLQHALNALQIDGTPLVEDGSFGRRTRAAVVAFQRAHDLDPDGIAGPLTAAAIEKAIA